MGWDGNGTLRWKMGWEMAGLTDVLENGMENRKNKNGRTLLCVPGTLAKSVKRFTFRDLLLYVTLHTV